MKQIKMNVWRQKLLYHQLQYECRYKQQNPIQSKPTGIKVEALSPAYYERLKKDVLLLEEFLQHFMELTHSHFIVDVRVDKQGQIDFDNIELSVNKRLTPTRNGDMPFAQVINNLSRILPFAELMTSLQMYSYNHQVSNLKIHMNGSLDDFKEGMMYPFVSPKLKEQWIKVLRSFADEASHVYSCNSLVPIFEGELCEDEILYSYSQLALLGDTL